MGRLLRAESGIAVSNGTVALDAAMRCLDLEPGDEVIVPTFTIISCAQAVIATGSVLLRRRRSENLVHGCWSRGGQRHRTDAAIMPVHIYGHATDMDPILDLAASRGLSIVEDAAEAHEPVLLRMA